ncbi:MAG TPA: AmmeMemoRadiSam system protein B [Gemmatimonadales bacterium]|nr:AmmeMemoRadiSam system protein B [Gemmatimonadales bacterium]
MGPIRAPAASGRFYPADPARLADEIDTLCRDARAEVRDAPPESAIAAIAPHAGLPYSGPTAARVFVSLALPRVIVIVAPNHTGVWRAPGGASLVLRGAFRTPLGDVALAEDLGRALLEAEPLVGEDADAHRGEHAIEVELPFLQRLRPDVRIVPLVLAFADWEPCRALGDTLARLVRAWPEPVLLLASSDLDHYEPAFVSERKDARALAAVEALDGAELLARCEREDISMCGRAAAATVLAAATTLGATRAVVVDYRHSGQVTGDLERVVGYGGVVIT